MLRLAVALVLLAGAALSGATEALPSRATTPPELRYRVVFTGAGGATSNYPPNPDGTVFTSTIDWKPLQTSLTRCTKETDFEFERSNAERVH